MLPHTSTTECNDSAAAASWSRSASGSTQKPAIAGMLTPTACTSCRCALAAYSFRTTVLMAQKLYALHTHLQSPPVARKLVTSWALFLAQEFMTHGSLKLKILEQMISPDEVRLSWTRGSVCVANKSDLRS